ncbi:MAG: lipid-A-disaccharide synthase [Paracoccaceae bacterium]
MTRIYLVAGEPSGDRLGAELIRGLKALAPDIEIAGVGGREMAAAGLDPLFDIADLSVMGLTEVLPRLPVILRRLRQTTGDVISREPQALVTIDAPSFGLRVAERVRRRAPQIRTIHYVAPSVWAWRPGRARHMARFVDHVLALLPFEPPFMEAAGMSCAFVGHPVAARETPPAEAIARIRARAGAPPGTPLLLVAPGSRRGEVARMMPVFAETTARLAAEVPELCTVVPVAETVAEPLAAPLAAMRPAPLVIRPDEGEAEKRAAFAAADAGLVASGTVALELAAADTPHVSCYAVSWATAAIARRLLRVDTGHLVNLVTGEAAVPECLQERCRPETILEALRPLIGGDSEAQRAAFGRAMAALGRGGEGPGLRAARSVIETLEKPRPGSAR